MTQMDADRCGYGTPWGCGKHLPECGPAKLLMHAAAPVNRIDNGHRLFHPECFEEIEPMTRPYAHLRLRVVQEAVSA